MAFAGRDEGEEEEIKGEEGGGRDKIGGGGRGNGRAAMLSYVLTSAANIFLWL